MRERACARLGRTVLSRPSVGLVVGSHRDVPEKDGGVEIYDCRAYRATRRHWNGAGLILHELCHVVHREVLGLDNRYVERLFVAAAKSGRYDRVPRRDFVGRATDRDRAYATVDPREFFAEMSVTWLADGWPELDDAAVLDADQLDARTCSPPLTCPTARKNAARRYATDRDDAATRRLLSGDPSNEDEEYYEEEEEEKEGDGDETSPTRSVFACWRSKRPADRLLANARSSSSSSPPMHCNKFFPFTKGQLHAYDPPLHDRVKRIWDEIETWEDEYDFVDDDDDEDDRCDFFVW